MSEYIEKIWLLPALAVLTVSLLLLILWRLPSSASRLAYVVRDIYEVMFWATPVVGVVVLSATWWLRHAGRAGSGHPLVRRAVWLSWLAVAAPAWLLLLQVVLSGFAR